MPRKRVLARIALFACIALAVTLALLPHPPHLIEVNDKAQHMLAFAVLAALAAFSYPGESLVRIGERLSFLGALIEVMQALPSLHRDCDIRDWIADTAAIAVILLLVWSAPPPRSRGDLIHAEVGRRHLIQRCRASIAGGIRSAWLRT